MTLKTTSPSIRMQCSSLSLEYNGQLLNERMNDRRGQQGPAVLGLGPFEAATWPKCSKTENRAPEIMQRMPVCSLGPE